MGAVLAVGPLDVLPQLEDLLARDDALAGIGGAWRLVARSASDESLSRRSPGRPRPWWQPAWPPRHPLVAVVAYTGELVAEDSLTPRRGQCIALRLKRLAAGTDPGIADGRRHLPSDTEVGALTWLDARSFVLTCEVSARLSMASDDVSRSGVSDPRLRRLEGRRQNTGQSLRVPGTSASRPGHGIRHRPARPSTAVAPRQPTKGRPDSGLDPFSDLLPSASILPLLREAFDVEVCRREDRRDHRESRRARACRGRPRRHPVGARVLRHVLRELRAPGQ